MKYTPALSRLIDALRCLPGVGPKSAQRMAFHLVERGRDAAGRLGEAIGAALTDIGHCSRCRMFTEGVTLTDVRGSGLPWEFLTDFDCSE